MFLSYSSLPCADDKAYKNGYVPINSKKIKDLQQLFQYIPEEYKDFYSDIMARPTSDEEMLEIED